VWRSDAAAAVRRGTLRTPTRQTLRQAAETWLEGAKAGTIRDRTGRAYKPSTIHGYERALNLRVLGDLGSCRLSEIRSIDLQDLADRLLAEGLDPSTIRNTLMPLRAIYRRACRPGGEVTINPTTGLQLPAPTGRRDRVVSPNEAQSYLAALPDRDRALWATALFGGLRRDELMGVRWEDIDLDAGVIRVERSWDPRAEVFTEPKSRAGLEPIGLHEARHTFASLMIGAGVNAKALSTYMGHASVTLTLDRYGHMFPGNEGEAAGLLDAYLQRATGVQTGAQGT
jgi:integrase